MEAFFDRGIHDLYASHDWEDILYIFNYTTNISEHILNADREVAEYLKTCVQRIMEDTSIRSVLPAHLFYETANERFEIIMEKMKNIVDGL